MVKDVFGAGDTLDMYGNRLLVLWWVRGQISQAKQHSDRGTVGSIETLGTSNWLLRSSSLELESRRSSGLEISQVKGGAF